MKTIRGIDYEPCVSCATPFPESSVIVPDPKNAFGIPLLCVPDTVLCMQLKSFVRRHVSPPHVASCS